jgi:hypothetical protein
VFEYGRLSSTIQTRSVVLAKMSEPGQSVHRQQRGSKLLSEPGSFLLNEKHG